MDFIDAERKAAWLAELQALESPENVYHEFYEDMQSGQGAPYAVDIIRNGNDDDYDYSVSVVTYAENLDRLILAGAWLNSDLDHEYLQKSAGQVYSLQGILTEDIDDDDLVEEYTNAFDRDIDQRLAEAIAEYAGSPKGIFCDIDSPDMETWNINVGSSAETLDEVADVIMAAEDVLTYWLDDLGPGVAEAAYGVLTDAEKEKVQEVLGAILESVES